MMAGGAAPGAAAGGEQVQGAIAVIIPPGEVERQFSIPIQTIAFYFIDRLGYSTAEAPGYAADRVENLVTMPMEMRI